MSISTIGDKILATLLPQDCPLCGADGGKSLLCPACVDSLPALPGPDCPTCALPSPGGIRCGTCLKAPPEFDTTHAVWRYAFPVDKLVQALKFEHRLPLAGFFAEAMLAGPRPGGDLLIPMPLGAKRLRERGFNQAGEIGRLLARATGMAMDMAACRRSLDTGPQSALPWKERRRNVKGAFECAIDLTGKSVVVVDDVMTTGATLDELARTLKRHGAARVSNWVVARAIRD